MLDVLAGGLIGAFAGFVWSWNKARLARDTTQAGGGTNPTFGSRVVTALIFATLGALIGAVIGAVTGAPRRTD